MSDTYNPDEIVRCKHLNEFARQLNIKLDGGIDPKAARPITQLRYMLPNNSYTNVPDNGVIHIASSTSKSLRVQITTPYDGTAPVLSDFSDDATDHILLLSTISWSGEAGLSDRRNLWQIQFNCDVNSTIDITPRTVSFNISFTGSAQYEPWSKNFIFIYTEG